MAQARSRSGHGSSSSEEKPNLVKRLVIALGCRHSQQATAPNSLKKPICIRLNKHTHRFVRVLNSKASPPCEESPDTTGLGSYCCSPHK